MRKADLHLHTHASSDASFDPEEVFSIAKARGLTALTFSDHDNTDSTAEGQRLAAIYDVAFLPGIEITSSWRGEEAHVLGFFLDGPLPSLADFLVNKIWSVRRQYNLAVLEYVQRQGTGVTISEHDAKVVGQERSESTALYQLLLKKGVVSNQRAFMALREESGVLLRKPPVPEAIQACHEAGGIAVVAHPGHDTGAVFTFDEENIAALAAEGLNGVEVSHPAHTEAQEDDYAQIADRLGLVKTGGSDMHVPRPEPQKLVGGTYCDWDEVLQYLER
jgi:predicted metal-dependent phosphoesterase TrpH